MKRQFNLLPEDQEFVESLGLPWETFTDRGLQWVVIQNYHIPKGYHQKEVSIAILIPAGYPRTQLDMVYFLPSISRRDGKPIKALSNMRIDNQSWQRWSRHRTSKNPWRAEVDNLSTHFALIDHWLEREFLINPYEVSA